MNDNLSKVYAKSAKSEQDYREYPEVLREALSIGKSFFQVQNFSARGWCIKNATGTLRHISKTVTPRIKAQANG